AKIFDARDPYVGGHAAQVAAYAVAIGQELGLSVEQLEVLRQSGYLHDIGKIAIPEAILHKPSKLTDEEYELLKHHANIGADFIETSQGLRHLAPFVRHHHERWDGRGYPDGLSAQDIPLEARILNVCDSVEAMASDRPYHRALSTEEIIAEVERCAGTQFDPAVVQAFVRVAEHESDCFIVNSARTVTRQQIERTALNQPLNLRMLAEVYGMTPA
ncbi:MAG: HD-GYP domain-containing protein, partial [Anaerolineales bacterium]|nr:HD-GYP domain-containing protein [Anaerolineales bacterium]